MRDKDSRLFVLLARGLLFWRWSMHERALHDLSDAVRKHVPGAPQCLLALRMCLGQWPAARELAVTLDLEEALAYIDGLVAAADSRNGVFNPSPATFEAGNVDVMPGVRQVDGR